MSWLKLNNDALFLMKGGDSTYIDKVEIKPAIIDGKDVEVIKDFPGVWFKSVQWPRTIVVNTDKSGEGTESFSNLSILRMLAIPIDKRFYKELSKAKKIPDLIEKFNELNGDYSDNFKVFQYSYMSDAGEKRTKDYQVQIIRFSYSEEASKRRDLAFPTNLFPPEEDIDITFENPAFADDIFLPVLNSAALTVRPSLRPRRFNPESENRKIGVTLNIVNQPSPSLVRSATTLETLEKSIVPKIYRPLSTATVPTLGDVVQHLLDTWGIAVNAPPDWSGNPTNILVPNPITFPEVMDEIGSQFNAAWDWFGPEIVRLIPLGS